MTVRELIDALEDLLADAPDELGCALEDASIDVTGPAYYNYNVVGIQSVTEARGGSTVTLAVLGPYPGG